MLSAIHECHRRNLAHLDLKCENFVLTKDYVVKLIDFGHCETFRKGEIQYFKGKGTVCCNAPEQKNNYYDAEKAEIFQLGYILFRLLHGIRPFGSNAEVKRMQDIYFVKPHTFWAEMESELRRKVDPETKKFLFGMLHRVP